MGWGEVLAEQLTDPFRMGLIVALMLTQARTEAVTGRWLPLAAGVVFVAVILPATMGAGEAPLWRAVVLGFAANVALLAAALAVRALVLRLRP